MEITTVYLPPIPKGSNTSDCISMLSRCIACIYQAPGLGVLVLELLHIAIQTLGKIRCRISCLSLRHSALPLAGHHHGATLPGCTVIVSVATSFMCHCGNSYSNATQ